MDQRERANDRQEGLRVAFEGLQAKLWTAMPGYVVSYDASKQTAVVQPTVQAQQRQQDGSLQNVNMPQCLDCPVLFWRGGGYTLTFPIAENDECLIVFASRCVDNWWQNGGIQTQAEMRMHDLSDGFVLVGPRSQVHLLSPPPDTGKVQLRSDDQTLYIELDHTAGTATIKTPTKVIVDTPEAHFTGKITADGDITSQGTVTGETDVVGDGTSLHTHTHGGVQTGSGNTGEPN